MSDVKLPTKDELNRWAKWVSDDADPFFSCGVEIRDRIIAGCREALRLQSELAHHRKLTAAMTRGGEKALEERGAHQVVAEALAALVEERRAADGVVIALEDKVASLSRAAASLGAEVIRMKAERAKLAQAWRTGGFPSVPMALVPLLDAIAEEGRGT